MKCCLQTEIWQEAAEAIPQAECTSLDPQPFITAKGTLKRLFCEHCGQDDRKTELVERLKAWGTGWCPGSAAAKLCLHWAVDLSPSCSSTWPGCKQLFLLVVLRSKGSQEYKNSRSHEDYFPFMHTLWQEITFRTSTNQNHDWRINVVGVYVRNDKWFVKSLYSYFVSSVFPGASVFGSHSAIGSSVCNRTYTALVTSSARAKSAPRCPESKKKPVKFQTFFGLHDFGRPFASKNLALTGWVFVLLPHLYPSATEQISGKHQTMLV